MPSSRRRIAIAAALVDEGGHGDFIKIVKIAILRNDRIKHGRHRRKGESSDKGGVDRVRNGKKGGEYIMIIWDVIYNQFEYNGKKGTK